MPDEEKKAKYQKPFRSDDISEDIAAVPTSKDEKKIEKVAQGKVRKKSFGKKFKDGMLGDDAAEVKEFLLWDVFVPALKDTIVDLIKKGADAIFYGGSTAPAHVKRTSNGSRASYAGYYDRQRERREREARVGRYNRRAANDFDDVIFENRLDAEHVLSNLIDLTMQYGMASVADFYELAGIDSQFTDNKYGWPELEDARVIRVRGGYILEMPRPEPID